MTSKKRIVALWSIFIVVTAVALISLVPYYQYWRSTQFRWQSLPVAEFQVGDKVTKVTNYDANIETYYRLRDERFPFDDPKSDLFIPTGVMSADRVGGLVGQTLKVRTTSHFAPGNWPMTLEMNNEVLLTGQRMHSYYLSKIRSFLYWIWIFFAMFGVLSLALGRSLRIDRKDRKRRNSNLSARTDGAKMDVRSISGPHVTVPVILPVTGPPSGSKLTRAVATGRSIWIFVGLIGLSAVFGSFSAPKKLNEMTTIRGVITKQDVGSTTARWTIRPINDAAGATAKTTSFDVDGDWFAKDVAPIDVLGQTVTVQVASNDKLFGLTVDGKILLDPKTSIKKDHAFSKGLGTFGYPLTGVALMMTVWATRLRRKAKTQLNPTT